MNKILSISFFLFCNLVFAQVVLNNEQLSKKIEEEYLLRQERIQEFLKDNPGKEIVRKENRTLYLEDFLYGEPIYKAIHNQGSANTLEVDQLRTGGALGLSLDGGNQYVGIMDGGRPRLTHQEFDVMDKVTAVTTDTSDPSGVAHATHVMGTVYAIGANTSAKGLAYNAKGYVVDFTTGNVFTKFQNIATHPFNIRFLNNSWGYVYSPNSPGFGAYTSNSYNIDNTCFSNDEFLMVFAAGNDRDTNPNNKNGYDLLDELGCAKNVITVGAVNEVFNYTGPNSVVMSGFSNWGPCDDGRIKPEVVAKGVSTFSSVASSDNSYAFYNGTSMAAPAITGLAALWQQHYNNVYGSYAKSATIRGLLVHTARESGTTPGPDYRFGYGLPDAAKGANIITDAAVGDVAQINEGTINSGQTLTFDVESDGSEPLVVTLSWTDRPSFNQNGGTTDLTTPTIVNNLDISVVKDGMTYYPWKLQGLTGTNYNLPATRNSVNNVDNIEKVEIDAPAAGTYTVTVSHQGSLTGGSQNFSMIISGKTADTASTKDVNALSQSVSIYPVPVTDVLNIDTKKQLNNVSLRVIDAKGALIVYQEVKNINLGNYQLNLQDKPAGTYLLVLNSDEGRITKKFVKK